MAANTGSGYGAVQETPLGMLSVIFDRFQEQHGAACKETADTEFTHRAAVRRRDELQEILEALGAVRERLNRPTEADAPTVQAKTW